MSRTRMMIVSMPVNMTATYCKRHVRARLTPLLARFLLLLGVLAPITASIAAPPLAAQTTRAATAATPLDFVAMDYAFRGPSRAAAGLHRIRLRNTGSKLHHVQLIRLDEGKRLGDVFPILQRNKGLHGLPAWAKPAGGVSAALPGQSIAITQRLAAGRYAVICWIPTEDGQIHVMKGMMTELEVTAATAQEAAEPVATRRVTLTEYKANWSAPLARGRQTLRIENTGKQSHELLVVRLAPGKSMSDVERWTGTGPAPMEMWTGLASIAPGGVAWLDLDVTPGRYAIFCFAPDARDAKPHAEHGFLQIVDIR